MVFLMFLFLIRYGRGTYVSGYNTTPFVLNYSRGFVSRGLLGSVWSELSALLGEWVMSYSAIYAVTWAATLLLFLLVFCLIVKSVSGFFYTNRRMALCFFLVIFLVPSFLGDEMFGRLDLYLYLLMFFMIFALRSEKFAFLVLPFSIISVCLHQGFVFTNFNLILVILLYETWKNKERQKKYLLLLLVTFLSVSALFLYFEFFSHTGTREEYESLVELAKSVSVDGESYSESLLLHEVLGEDVYEAEMQWHIQNMQEFPFFMILMAPYIFLGMYCAVRTIRRAKETCAGWPLYTLMFLGGVTIIPEMILKVDYGRYMCVTLLYYVLLLLLFAEDEVFAYGMEQTISLVRRHVSFPLLLVVYPVFLVPFFDVSISGAVHVFMIFFTGV